MASWSELVAAEPELTAEVRARFEAYGFGLLATLRQDGSPRISRVEPLFALDELWLGLMPGSRKALDLVRDPRFALHCATIDQDLGAGDAKLSGQALMVDDEPSIAEFRLAFEARTGDPPTPGPFPLFRADVLDMSIALGAGDRLDIQWWREGEGVGHVERR